MIISHCRLKKSTQVHLVKYFAPEVTARSVPNILKINPDYTTLFYCKFCQIIAFDLAKEVHEIFQGDIEIYESYFDGVSKGTRGRGAAGKVVVFGILKHHGKVYPVVVENTKTKTLLNRIAHKIKTDDVVYTDAFKAMMHLTLANSIITELSFITFSLMKRITSTGLKPSRTRLR